MRIALLCDEIKYGPECPDKELLVGALRPYYIGKEFAKLGHEVTLFSPYPKGEKREGISYIPLKLHKQSGPFDVAIARNWYMLADIQTKHCYVWMGDDGDCIFAERRWELCPRAKFVVESSFMLGKYKPFTSVHSVIPYGIREEVYSNKPSWDKRWNIFTSCVWDPCRHVVEMVEAFRLIAKDFSEARLHMFGSSANWGRTRDMYTDIVTSAIAASGVADRIVIHGTIPHNQMIQALGPMGIFVHLTSRETFGVAVREAMAAGIPVCSNHCEGLNQVAYWPDCKQDPRLASEEIAHLLSDRDYYEKCSKMNRDSVQGISWPDVTKTWLHLLEADGCFA